MLEGPLCPDLRTEAAPFPQPTELVCLGPLAFSSSGSLVPHEWVMVSPSLGQLLRISDLALLSPLSAEPRGSSLVPDNPAPEFPSAADPQALTDWQAAKLVAMFWPGLRLTLGWPFSVITSLDLVTFPFILARPQLPLVCKGSNQISW